MSQQPIEIETPVEEQAVEAQQPPAYPSPGRILRGVQAKAWKALIYGEPGVGKSTLGALAPGPLFLNLEDGLARVDCAKTERLTTLDQVYKWLDYARQLKNLKTVVIDTLDELDRMLSQKVCDDWNKLNTFKAKTVSDIPYGRGGDLLAAEWRELIKEFEEINAAGKNVLLIGHQQVVSFKNPTDADFDQFTVNVHKKVAPVITAKLDAVLFARYETFVKGVDDDKGKAVATGRRILHTTQGASYVAKSRFPLPAVVGFDEFSFETFT